MPTEVSEKMLIWKLREVQKRGMEQRATLENNILWLPPFLSLMWLTGARVSEVLKLRGRDLREYEVDGERVILVSLINLKQRSAKNRVKEGFIIPSQYPVLWGYIEEWWRQHPEGAMFHKSRKTVWYHCDKLFNIGAHRAGRHSWVMEKARRGTPILDVRQMGGWKKLNSMDSYIHVFGRKEMARRLMKTEKSDF